ncbi:CACNA1S [Symbiodinium sp. CCMP2592]|nr:CACNA1S [Symbiodinium sp. CCMP2592]
MVETMASEEGQASHDQTVSLDAALKLAEGARNEEKVLGATLALRHHSELLVDAAGGRKPRQRLRAAVVDADATFICRLLQSSLPLQRLALGLLRVLLAGDDREAEEASAELGLCAKWLVEACAGAAAEVRPAAGATASKEASQERFGTEELCDTSDLLQRLLDLSAPSTEVEAGGAAVQTDARADIAKESCRLLSMLLPGGKLAALLSKEVACKSLALAESLLLRCQFLQRPPPQEAFALAESVVVAESLRGSSEQAAALGLLTAGQSQAKRQVIERWEEVIGASVGGGAPAQHALLQLVAEALPAWGLGLGAGSKSSSSPLSRLKPILVLAAGELRMGLEGYGTQEGLCAACMMLEAAIVALGKEAEALESSNLEEVSNSLRELHRAVQDIYDFLADLPRDLATPPKELPMVARVVAAFQVEDPRQFSAEFQRNLWALCLLPPSEFQVLLPCLQELQDWQATPGFGKVLETATWGLGLSLRGDPVGLDLEGLEDAQLSESPEVWRQCSLMLAEVALDAAVYLPDVSIPELSIDEATLLLPSGCFQEILIL